MVEPLFQAALVLHIVSGSLAVAVGWYPIVSPKPRFDPSGGRHRKVGRWFAHLMKVVIGSAIVMTLLHPDPYFAGLTASAGLVAFSGVRVLRRKRPDIDPAQRARSLDWLVTLAATGVAVMLIVAMARGELRPGILPVVRALAWGTLAYALWDLVRFTFPRMTTPNLWLYEHIVKIVGAYFAAVAAFSGSILLLFPEPWRQLWATNLGFVIAAVMVTRYWRRIRREPLNAL
jgi:hypothetical protein